MRSSNAASWSRSRPARWGGSQSGAALRPHLSRYRLNARPDDPEAFAAQVEDVCDSYRSAPQRLESEGIHTVSVDEMTGIQATERIAPTKPARPAQVERREFEYRRHGTQCLIGNFEVATGEVIAPTVQPTPDRGGPRRPHRADGGDRPGGGMDLRGG